MVSWRARAADDAYKRNRTESSLKAVPRTTGGWGFQQRMESWTDFCCCSRSTGGTLMDAKVSGDAAWRSSGLVPWQLFPDPLGVPFPDLPDWCKGRRL